MDICWDTKYFLQKGIWAQKFIGSLKDCGITRVWDYQELSDETQMRMSDFADSFFVIILDIQQDRPDLIATAIDVINDYEI